MIGCADGGVTWWGSALVLALLQGAQQLLDLIREVRLFDQVLR